MSNFCAVIVEILLFIGVPTMIILIIVNLIKKKSIKFPLCGTGLCMFLIVAFSIIEAFTYEHTPENLQMHEQQRLERLEKKHLNALEEQENENKNITPVSAPEITQKPLNDVLKNEIEFKNLCTELIYNDINKNSIGTYVYKDLFSWNKNDNKNDTDYDYSSVALEDFIEDLKSYQYTYRNYYIKDYRFDKTFPIESNDILRVYGVIEDVSWSYFNGQYNPKIKMYYADYIRKYRKEVENKTIEQIKNERYKKYKEQEEEKKYKNSLNTDYTGITKNDKNMNELPLNEYIKKCDKVNYSNLTNGEDFTGRHICLNVQTFSMEKFVNENRKNNKFKNMVNPQNVQDNFWICKIYSEMAGYYIIPYAHFETLYFLNTEKIYPSNLKKEQNLIIYGQITKFDLHNKGDMEILVRYYEIK